MLGTLALATILGGSGFISSQAPSRFPPSGEEVVAVQTLGWETTGPYGGDVAALAILQTEPGNVFAAVRCAHGIGCGVPVYMSTDLAATWDTAHLMFGDGQDPRRVAATMDGRVLVAERSGLKRREVGGIWFNASFSYEPIREGRPVDIAVSRLVGGPAMLAMASTEPGTGGLAMATVTSGWYFDATPDAAIGLDGTAVAMHPEQTGHRAAAFATAQGTSRVFITTDSGTTWQERTVGLPAARVVSLAYRGLHVLAAVEGHGIYAFHPSQPGWTALAPGQAALSSVTRIVVSPHDSQMLLAATPGGLSRSVDGGTTWKHRVQGTRGLNVLDIAISPDDPDVVLLGAQRWGVLSSVDGAQSFLPSTEGIQNLDVRDVAAHPGNPRRMAAIAQSSGPARLMESFDAGNSWTLGLSLPAHANSLHFDTRGRLHTIARMDPDTPPMLYRLNTGRSWQRLPAPAPGADMQSVYFDPLQPGVIHVAGADAVGPGARAMTWTSYNDGLDWSVTWTGLEDHVATQILGFADELGDWLLVPTRSLSDMPGMVAISQDNGQSWRETVMGFPRWDRHIQLCRHEGSQTVFAYTRNVNANGDLFSHQLTNGSHEWQHWSSSSSQGTAGFVCGDPGTEELFVGSEQRIGFWDPILRKVGGSSFERYDEDFPLPLPERATRMILTPAGLFLASEIGLFRNRAPVNAPAPEIVQVSDERARMAHYVEVRFQGGASWVRVLRDGVEIEMMPNKGSFRERRLLDGSNPSYQVCNAFVAGCSEPVNAGP